MKIPKNMRVAEFGDHGRGARVWRCTRGRSRPTCSGIMDRCGASLISQGRPLKQVGGLYQPVQDLSAALAPHLRGRAALMHGGDDSGIGAICFVPHALAKEVYELVRERYAKAIPILIHYRARKV